MRKILLLMLAVTAITLSGLAWADGGKGTTQKYEVVCLKCMAHNAAMGKDGGHGAGHAACAMSCSTKGMDMGLMDSNGTLYEAVHPDFTSAREAIKDKAGQTLELTGTVVKTKGINYLVLAGSAAKDGDKDGD